MSKLKFENNFTTYEQSNELLKLGIPADTADCILLRCYDCNNNYYEDVRKLKPGDTVTKYNEALKSNLLPEELNDFCPVEPCWSLGRLQEIWSICTLEDWTYKESFMNHIGWIISDLAFEQDAADIDFELELKNYGN
jgi:hypothetical protein